VQRRVHPRHEGGDGGVADEGHLTGDRLHQHQGQRVDVGLPVEGGTLSLLRRGVAGRSQHGIGRLRPGRLGQRPGDPEVGDGEAALVVEQQVGGLDVPVDETLAVGIVQAVGHLEPHLEGLGRGEAVPPVQEIPKAAPLEELKHQVRAVLGLAPVVDPHDVGVVERRRLLGLGSEAAQEDLVLGQAGVKDLHRHAPTQGDVLGEEDVGRAPRSDGRHQAVPAAQDSADLVGHSRRGHGSRVVAEGARSGDRPAARMSRRLRQE
jgi:hypothetical protein